MKRFTDLKDLKEVMTKFPGEMPYDPAYLEEEGYEPPRISRTERSMLRKLSILINKLKRNKVRFEWLPDEEMLQIKKFRKHGGVQDEYPSYMYLAIYDEGQYAFGGETTDVCISTRVSDVVDAAVEWLHNNKPSAK